VGCGTGGNAAYLAEHYDCRVTGIDISELMVEQAKKRTSQLNLQGKLNFINGDAYSLDFPDETFDAVITIFVSQFLDANKAFPEFMRVLKLGGYLGINEMYRLGNVPEEDLEKVDYTEHVFRDLTELPFSIRSPETWEKGFIDSGFSCVLVEPFSEFLSVKSSLDMIKDLGGWLNLFRLLWRTFVLALKSKKIRERYGKLSKGKNVMLRDKKTSKYFGYVIGVGKK
jgi:ubiquinone/menaquinone biosynthesis C-methylase UbiE